VAIQKTNKLWKTYFFIVATSIIFACAIAYTLWGDIHNDAQTELIHANRTASSATRSTLRKSESLLTVIGQRLIDFKQRGESNTTSKQILNELLSSNPDILGFGLAVPSGKLIITSFDIPPETSFNLQKKADTAASFKQALNSSYMIVGRTYYAPFLDQWVIPLRQRITDTNGKITGVMTAGLKLNHSGTIGSRSYLPHYINTFILRKDLYRQQVPENVFNNPENIFNNPETVYSKPASDKWMRQFQRDFRNGGLKLSTIREQSPEIFTGTSLLSKNMVPALTAVSYNKRYAYYTATTMPYAKVTQRLVKPLAWLSLALVIFNSVLFWLFRSNIRLQNDARKNLEHQATRDQLTGLPNRRHLVNIYPEWIANCQEQFYAVFIDLDNFKLCNDLHGHSVGDQVLQEVASRINQSFPNCLKIRPGGDEFIILCPDTESQSIIKLCNQFLQNLKQPIFISNLDFSISASIGIAHAPMHGTSLDDLLRKADMAMYQAKKTGSSSSIYSNNLEKEQQKTALIEKQLRRALERNEFSLVYQPQVDSQTKAIIGVEALIRWNNEELGTVPPDVFIPIAESTGLIIDIGRFVLETSMQEMASIIQSKPDYSNLRLSVNISIHQLFSATIIDEIQYIVKKHPSPVLAVEITESLFIDDFDAARVVLERIQACGVDISLDDFGTGYSSLSVLNQLPIDELKIDRSFVQHVLTEKNDEHLIKGIINLGKALQIPVLSEGVEEQEQADLLLEFGCDLFQGYFFSKPLNKEDFSKYLTKQNNTA